MLPGKNRLKKKKDFERVFRQGESFKKECLVLRLAKNNLKVVRFGFVVGLKVSKKASLRNKIRRRLKAITKARLPQIKTGFDVVLIASKDSANKTFQEMAEIVNSLFKKAKI